MPCNLTPSTIRTVGLVGYIIIVVWCNFTSPRRRRDLLNGELPIDFEITIASLVFLELRDGRTIPIFLVT